MRLTKISEKAPMNNFVKTVLYTDSIGRAKFRDEAVDLSEGTPQSMLSSLMSSGGMQLRRSPVGFRSQFHCTGMPQWVFILRGQMEIGLQDGSSRVFTPMPRCMGIGVGRWARSLWKLCLCALKNL
jgi:hypothetical protein